MKKMMENEGWVKLTQDDQPFRHTFFTQAISPDRMRQLEGRKVIQSVGMCTVPVAHTISELPREIIPAHFKLVPDRVFSRAKGKSCTYIRRLRISRDEEVRTRLVDLSPAVRHITLSAIMAALQEEYDFGYDVFLLEIRECRFEMLGYVRNEVRYEANYAVHPRIQ